MSRTETGERLLERLRVRMEAMGGEAVAGADYVDVRRALPSIEAEAAMPDPDPRFVEDGRDPDEEWSLGFRSGLRVGRATYNPFLFFVGLVTGLLLGAAVARL